MADLNFVIGDLVRFRLAREEIEGTVVGEDSSVYVVKLKSGYNVGISKENILGGRAVKKFVDEEKKKIDLPFDSKLKNVGMIVTGGTIASKLDPKTGGAKWLSDVGELAKFYPEVFKIANVKKIEVPFMAASEDMNFEHWAKIAECAEKMLNDDSISGVIVTHGTDFLHYTSAALSFFLRDLNKPVVLTYSQRSIDRPSSDANMNLQCAARMAISDCAEVILVGHGSINDDFCLALRGTKARKMHSSRRDTFKSVNAEPIAKISFGGEIEFLSEYNLRNENKVLLDKNFSDKVALVKFYPGQDSSILDFHALKCKGIIIEGSGLGHVSVDGQNSWLAKLKKHIRGGLVVCMATQTIFGRVDPYVYSNARELLDAGVIFLEDMSSETALVKLGWVLGHYGWKAHVKEKMMENFAGEFNSKISYKRDLF